MITKTIFEDNKGKIEEYKLKPKFNSVKKISLRKIDDVEIILINYARHSEILIQFDDNNNKNLENVKKRIDSLDDKLIGEFEEYKSDFHELHDYEFNKIEDLIEEYKYCTMIPYVFDSESCPESGNVIVWHKSAKYLEDYRTYFISSKIRYDFIQKKLESIVSDANCNPNSVLKDIIYLVKKPELYQGTVLYFKVKNNKKYAFSAENLLKKLFDLTDKTFCIDASIEKIKDAWSG